MEFLVHVPWWIWIVMSFIPYSIKRQKTPNMQSLALLALGWQFTFKYQKMHYSWSFSLPWIKQLQRMRDVRILFISEWKKLIYEWVKKF